MSQESPLNETPTPAPAPAPAPMPAPHAEPPHPGYAPQGYGNYYDLPNNPYYQFGYEGEQPSIGQRTLRDYLMIVRERVWYLVLAVFIFTTGALLYTGSVEPEYKAQARFQVYRSRANVTGGIGSTNTDDKDRLLDDRDFNTKLASMRSTAIIQRVARRLTQEQRNEALAPYQKGNIFSGPMNTEEVIGKCRNIQPERQSFMAVVEYTHPNKELAKIMPGYFVEEIQRATDEETSQIVDPLVERLKIQNDQILVEIQDLQRKKTELIEREKILTLTSSMPTAAAELSQLASAKESDKRAYEEIKANRDQLLAFKAAGQSPAALPFIARDERVMGMNQELSKLEIALSSALKSYTDEHPKVVQIRSQIAQARVELAKASAEAEAKLDATFKTAAVNFENSVKRFEAKESDITAQRKAVTAYESLEKDIRNKEELYSRMNNNYELERAKQGGLNSNPIRLVDPASVSDRPVNKNAYLALALGLFGGGAVGLGIVFLLASLDDRVKSAADIEQFVGLPLMGVIPKITKLDNFKRARTVANNADRATTEAFHAIYSALKIHDQARKARAMLITSTTPSEGKSFFTTNLAMTYAMHGEKVIVVDADLRLPNVGKSLQLQGDSGITKYQAGMIDLDEAIRRDIVPNMDVLPVGASCKNPTQVLNSKKFAAMIEELKGRYDRVFIDSPPVGAVSDALNLMPQVDGALYVVKFNTVKRKSIKGNLRRLKESKVPVFGAVLNQIGLHVANYYTATYDKAYNKYYHDTDPNAVEVKVS